MVVAPALPYFEGRASTSLGHCKNLTALGYPRMSMKEGLPLLDHPVDEPTAFSPEALTAAVRAERHLSQEPIPQVCVLELDGDLTDWLVSTGAAHPWKSWACFHTTMFTLEVDGVTFGVVPRTIGGPYAVLVAEQMAVSGARVVLGLTSAGRVASAMPVPGLVAVTSAIRDEGTSYHYLPPAQAVDAPSEVASLLESELRSLPLPVLSGPVWTTDAPYRETEKQLARHARAGVLAVEMQAASLFAFSSARRFPVGVVAHVTNSVGHEDEQFHKGTRELEFEILRRICRAGNRLVSSSNT
jgi:uridine phosphorylase